MVCFIAMFNIFKPYFEIDFPRHIEDSIKCDFKELSKCIDVHHVSSLQQSPEPDTFLLHIPEKLIKSDLEMNENTENIK